MDALNKKELESLENVLSLKYMVPIAVTQKEMEQQGLIKLDSDVLSITYVAPINKELLDTTRLKNERNDVY